MTEKEYKHKYYLKNKEKIRKAGKEYRLNNREEIRVRQGEYRLKNREEINRKALERWHQNSEQHSKERREKYSKNKKFFHLQQHAYYLKNRENIRSRAKKIRTENKEEVNRKKREIYADPSTGYKEMYKSYNIRNKEKISKYNKQYRLKNIDVINTRQIKWREENGERVNAEARTPEARKRRRELSIKRRADPTFHLIQILRRRIHHILGGRNIGIKTLSTLELLGVTNVETVWKHLEKHFESGMTRKNNTTYGWHIDHHIPIDYFAKKLNLMDIDIQKKCFHYTNLRPLWATDNLKKGAKYDN